MKLSTCPKGHFYDADKYASCPYCVPQDEAEAVTEALNVTMEDFFNRSAINRSIISRSSTAAGSCSDIRCSAAGSIGADVSGSSDF